MQLNACVIWVVGDGKECDVLESEAGCENEVREVFGVIAVAAFEQCKALPCVKVEGSGERGVVQGDLDAGVSCRGGGKKRKQPEQHI